MNKREFGKYQDRDQGAYDSGFLADVDVPQHRIGRGAGGNSLSSNIITFTSYWNGLIESSADAAAYARSRGWKLQSWMDPLKCPVFHVARGWLLLDNEFMHVLHLMLWCRNGSRRIYENERMRPVWHSHRPGRTVHRLLRRDGNPYVKSAEVHAEGFKDKNGYKVKSSRRGGYRGDRSILLDAVRRLTLEGRSANQIALEIGVCDRSVTRLRKEIGVTPPPIESVWDYYRDKEKAIEAMANAARWRRERTGK